MRDALSEPGCSGDQEQPCSDDDGSDGSRDALTGRCETFGGDGCHHDSHRAQVHDPDDEEDRRQAGTAVAAVEAEAQAVSPGRAGVRRQCAAAPRCLPAAGKVMCLPRGELERAGDQDDHTDRDRNGARQRRQLHLDRRQRDAQRKGGHSERGPHGEVPHAHQRGQPTQARLACPADGLAVPPQHWHQGWQHHRYHHHDPHAEERRRGVGPGLSGHPHPRHRHRPATGHRHLAHRRHGRAPDDRHRRAGGEEQRRDAEEGSLGNHAS
jgi:hypothetical protein